MQRSCGRSKREASAVTEAGRAMGRSLEILSSALKKPLSIRVSLFPVHLPPRPSESSSLVHPGPRNEVFSLALEVPHRLPTPYLSLISSSLGTHLSPRHSFLSVATTLKSFRKY